VAAAILGLALGAGSWGADEAPVPAAKNAAEPAAPKSAPEAVGFKNKREMASYAFGVDTQRTLKKLGLEIDPDLLAKGMKDAAAGGKLALGDPEIDGLVAEFKSAMLIKTHQLKSATLMENQQTAAEFLAANKTKEGVTALPSGLQFKVLKAGTGKLPGDADTVECNVRGTLLDGTEIENTWTTKEPAVFAMSDVRVIAGLREALKYMPVGSKWQLFIPSRLAFLNVARPPLVPPNALLIYEVELLSIK
jgi:FKBP-type peptidyl-prolyl cis-trans isomerase FklB